MEEAMLIERAANGDAQAFNELMGMQEKRMYAISLRMCGNREDAQDCMQEAMLRIYRAMESFKSQSSFSTWVYRVTINTCLDELRRRKNRPNTSLDLLLDSGWSPVDARDTPEQHTVRREVRQGIESMIHELPEEMRAAILLRDVHGLPYETIADVLNTNVGTVKSRISRGREKLRAKITAHSELFDKYRV